MKTFENPIRRFSGFLSASWEFVLEIAKQSEDADEFVSAWTQANWELLVESMLPHGSYLNPYAGGADYYPDSSRIYMPDALPTHIVVCTAKNSESYPVDKLSGNPIDIPSIGFSVEELVAMDGDWFSRKPPFDHIRVGDQELQHVFALDDINIFVRPILEQEI